MKIRAKQAGLILIITMVSGIVISMTTGYWSTESSKIPSKYTEGDLAGISNPADIRGSYSLEDINKAFDIPVETLAEAFGLSGESEPALIKVKTFEEIYGIVDGKEIGTDSMRLFVSLYKNLPYIPEEDTALPNPAVSILKKTGTLTEQQLKELTELSLSMEMTHSDEIKDHVEISDEQAIKGKTLFSELYTWGITEEQLEIILGIPVGMRTQSVRDYCMDNNIEFSVIKEQIESLLSK